MQPSNVILKEFYQSYEHWLNCGAPHLQPHRRDVGLCSALSSYMDAQKVPLLEQCDVFTQLKMQFSIAGLDHEYPFESPDAYTDCTTMHLNVKRREWVYERAR